MPFRNWNEQIFDNPRLVTHAALRERARQLWSERTTKLASKQGVDIIGPLLKNVASQIVGDHDHGEQTSKSDSSGPHLFEPSLGPADVGECKVSSIDCISSHAKNLETPAVSSDFVGPDHYPQYAFDASPTFHSWVGLTAADIHFKLLKLPGYIHDRATKHPRSAVADSFELLFYKNHPIRFVELVGIVLSFEEYLEKVWLFTLDDSSGSIIDVVCHKVTTDSLANKFPNSSGWTKSQRNSLTLSEQVKTTVRIGSIYRVRGTIVLYRRNSGLRLQNHSTYSADPLPTRQLLLSQLSNITDTAEEIVLLTARNDFYNNILAKSWKMTGSELKELRSRWAVGIERERQATTQNAMLTNLQAQAEREDAKSIFEDYQKEDIERQIYAEKAAAAGKSLVASNAGASHVQALVSPLKNSGRVIVLPQNRSISCREPTSFPIPEYNTVEREGERDVTASFGPTEDERTALLRAAFG